MGCSPPGSSVHGILQARILEWVAISFSARDQISVSYVSCIAGRFFTYKQSGVILQHEKKKKIHHLSHFKLYDSLALSTFMILCNHPLDLIPESFHHSKQRP